ncbi:hypothetical protein IQ07DRAFT_335570 [Pyrenochaeta sp. DS3sAY3a]|nr:hypothetical protein IQ07DRAFT_335570 [Pyrenochaeta sp. DS3sAY3a]
MLHGTLPLPIAAAVGLLPGTPPSHLPPPRPRMLVTRAPRSSSRPQNAFHGVTGSKVTGVQLAWESPSIGTTRGSGVWNTGWC